MVRDLLSLYYTPADYSVNPTDTRFWLTTDYSRLPGSIGCDSEEQRITLPFILAGLARDLLTATIIPYRHEMSTPPGIFVSRCYLCSYVDWRAPGLS